MENSDLSKIIKVTERFVKTDVRYIAKGGFWLVIGQIASSLAGLALTIGFSHLVSKEVYGNYRYALSLAGVIAGFSLTGMGNAIIRAVAKGFEGTVMAGFKTKLVWGAAPFFISLAAGFYYLIQGDIFLSLSLFLIGVSTPFIESGKLFGHLAVGRKDFKTSAIYSVWYKLVPTVILLAIIFYSSNPLIIVSAYFISQALVSMALYFISLRKFQPNHKIDFSAIKFGKQLSFINILSDVAQYIDQIIIFNFLGAAQLAIYNFAFIVPDKIRSLLRLNSQLSLPKFSDRQFGEIASTLPRKFLIMISLTFILAGVYILAAPLIFSLLFPQYQESVFYSQIASLVIVSGGMMSIVNSAFFAHKKIFSVSVLNLTYPIVQIMLVIIFWYWLGFLGVVISRVISQWFGAAIHVVALKITASSMEK